MQRCPILGRSVCSNLRSFSRTQGACAYFGIQHAPSINQIQSRNAGSSHHPARLVNGQKSAVKPWHPIKARHLQKQDLTRRNVSGDANRCGRTTSSTWINIDNGKALHLEFGDSPTPSHIYTHTVTHIHTYTMTHGSQCRHRRYVRTRHRLRIWFQTQLLLNVTLSTLAQH